MKIKIIDTIVVIVIIAILGAMLYSDYRQAEVEKAQYLAHHNDSK